MPRKPTVCAYCGEALKTGPWNTEHFVPRCFWGDTPLPIRTQTVRVHTKCNDDARDDAEYLRNVLVMAAGTREHPVAAQILDGPLARKMDKQFGEVAKILGEPEVVDVVSPGGIWLGKDLAFKLIRERRNRALATITRGVFFTVTGRPLSSDAEFRFPDQCESEFLHVLDDARSFGDTVFQYRYRMFDTDPNAMILFVRFYDRHTLAIVVTSPSYSIVLQNNDAPSDIRVCP